MMNLMFRDAKHVAKNACLISVILLIGTLSSQGLAQSKPESRSSHEAYAEFYGSGLRHYTEGNYIEAIDQLFRAFALRPSAELHRVIIRSYDFMGHCDAAQKQRIFFTELYPRETVPQPDLCQKTAQLTIECTPARTPVTVNYVIDSHCGDTLNVVPGKIHIDSQTHGSSLDLNVKSGEKAVAQIKLNAEKWPKVEPTPQSNSLIRVPRLPTRQSEYAVYQSRDGLYQIWVRAELRSEQDLATSPDFQMQPRVEIICAEDGPDSDKDCVFLRSLQNQSPHYTDNPQRHKSSVPIVP